MCIRDSPGTCVECGARFHAGDPIARADDDEGWVHTSCDDPTDDREPCTRCWLTICECEQCPRCWLTLCDCDKDTR